MMSIAKRRLPGQFWCPVLKAWMSREEHRKAIGPHGWGTSRRGRK